MAEQYVLMTLDPVHIGTGGYRLGRVDNSIVREPGTNLPKIPGTSLSGAIRAYAAYEYGKVSCAGQSGHCGEPTCPICYTFGYIKGKDENQKARAGAINIFDAQILFFPVWSMMGPVWVTTKNILDRFGITGKNIVNVPDGKFIASFERNKALNFGWLMLEPNNGDSKISELNAVWGESNEWNAIKERIAVVSESIFSRIVNDNLEVRTSVSINPETGAAESGALFTYEAIPRSTFLVLEVVQHDFRNEFPNTTKKAKIVDKDKGKYQDNAGDKLGKTWSRPIDVFESGLSHIELLGVGGMGTRGFGRVRWVTAKNNKQEETNINAQNDSKPENETEASEKGEGIENGE